MFKKERGITLVALVVTIVVLLILAGVSISMVLGNNGMVKKAKDSQAAQDKAYAKEVVESALKSVQIDVLTGKVDMKDVNANLVLTTIKGSEAASSDFDVSGSDITYTKNGKVFTLPLNMASADADFTVGTITTDPE